MRNGPGFVLLIFYGIKDEKHTLEVFEAISLVFLLEILGWLPCVLIDVLGWLPFVLFIEVLGWPSCVLIDL